MSDRRVDRQLLIGLLGLQCGMISRDQLVAAFGVWTGHKDRDLVDILAEQRAVGGEQRRLLTALVEQHCQRHGSDLEQSLRQLSSIDSVRDDLRQFADPDIQVSLAQFGTARDAETAAPVREADPLATIAPQVDSLAAGGRYVVVQLLARGGLGSVSIAKDLELNRHVAFKQILPEIADNLDARVRFQREAEITGGLEHPGIVPIYGLGTDSRGRPFYAMKLIRGDTLKDAVARFHADREAGKAGFDALAFRELLRAMIDVSHAVQYAHDRGVLHRDLKPGNIMLGKYGETLVVDWGLAKPLSEQVPDDTTTLRSETADRPVVPRTSLSESGSTETQTGEAKGTPAYMSPEQARGDWETLGPATDIYALGATLYSVLTASPPIEARDAAEALTKAAQGIWRPPRARLSTIPRPLDAVCRKALALPPNERYATARDFAADIERWLANESVTAEPEPFFDLAGRLTRKYYEACLIAVVAGAMVMGMLVVATVRYARTEQLLHRLVDEVDQTRKQEREARQRLITLANSSGTLEEFRKAATTILTPEEPDVMQVPSTVPAGLVGGAPTLIGD